MQKKKSLEKKERMKKRENRRSLLYNLHTLKIYKTITLFMKWNLLLYLILSLSLSLFLYIYIFKAFYI